MIKLNIFRFITFGRFLIVFFLLNVVRDGKAQSLFDSALSANEGEQKYTLNGFVRSSVFSDFKETKNITAETSLKLETKEGRFGKAYVEARYKNYINSTIQQEERDELYLREVYCDLRFNKFDLRIGQQIIVWGRADGFNPTNNITPMDMTIFSSDEDEKRLENFVSRLRYNAHPFVVEMIWVPVYRANKLPIEGVQFADNAVWGSDIFPDTKTDLSSYGLKADLFKASFDASFSFYNGYYKMPSLGSRTIADQKEVFRSAFRTRVLGADFSTVAGKYGLRGEFAYSLPDDDEIESFIPNDQLEYTIGLDREWGNFNIIAQYIGKHVIDYKNVSGFEGKIHGQLHFLNSILFAQTDEFTHSMSLRPAIKLKQETIEIELLSLANFTTEELYLKPLIEYKISDDISVLGGAQLYYGSDDSLFGLLEKKINSAFAEVKISF